MKASDLGPRLTKFRAELGKTCLIGVTKYSTLEDTLTAYEAGLYDLGENKVQDLTFKAQHFHEKDLDLIRWHFIGHLQSNKVKDLYKVPGLYAIHSVDSLKLLKELYKRESEFKGSSLKIFLQFNTSKEEEKSGFESLEELREAVDFCLSQKGSRITLHGLMTMGSIRESDFVAAAHHSFSELQGLKEVLLLSFKELLSLKLSMGMSQDYKIALSYGADYVRIGSALFGSGHS